MFTENDISTMIEDPEVKTRVIALKDEFKEKEAPLLEISEHDFLSLILLVPSIGIALANGSISLFEELSLNKKARRFSKGGYFLKADPVIHAMKFLFKKYDTWEGKFFETITFTMSRLYDKDDIEDKHLSVEEISELDFNRYVMKAPYIFIKSIPAFFLPEDEDISNIRSISDVEYKKVLDIVNKLGLKDIPIIKKFVKTFEVK